ncbi:MAG TPA: Gfo/Idh/MocA family oxidoreductase [Bacteroidales bacterium]|nr:Gfo/Idh/MocA family oxidoreductase [Bacteroidales bacterium]HPF02006.1 Gfo/Idh/MocA family oxidoreductase [Bacteroidales bacterium]HPR12578.1 Gfo/Idh/MocA family oxidoreductase [Bacteroidales bacterium]HRW86529.1 Gfo/Idh/MocA family oxidoreductase [Bacteroidales bacterium]
MKNPLGRRDFLRTTVAGAMSAGLAGKGYPFFTKQNPVNKRVGIIGLDTSHSVAFTRALNNATDDSFLGYKIVAAYPRGSNDIKSSVDRIPGYTEDVKKLGVKIVSSIDELLKEVDCVMLETNDGRLHFEQAVPVMKAGKRMFIDKPVAASLSDAIAIYEAAAYYKVPVFSSSSLRYISGAKEIAEGGMGKVLGADVYSPATLEKTHPDLFWYGVHGVEILFTVMGKGCRKVSRTFTPHYDQVTGEWDDQRIGTFRGIRNGKSGYGGTVFCEKEICVLGKYSGYNPLLEKIVEFFDTGIVPVTSDETIEIFTFMAAAEESRFRKGAVIETAKVLEKAGKKASKLKYI